MENVENTPSAAGESAKPVKKRSMPEKLVVWGGIIILVLVVYVEATSKANYEASYKAVQDALLKRDDSGRTTAISVDQIGQYIKGSPSRTDQVEEEKTQPAFGEPKLSKQRRIRYRWFSLFKHYEFRLSFGKDDQVVQIDPVIPGIEN